MNTQERSVVALIVDALEDGRIVLRVPGTDYRLHLSPAVPAAGIGVPVGRRIRGTIAASALRIHAAAAGGRYIEPVIGEPRIIAGTVLAVEPEAGRVLVDAAVPIWLSTDAGQDFGVIREGGLVNCYVRSGAQFIPAG